MRKLALALLIASTPAAAQNAVEPSHEVRFEGVTFTCGKTNDPQAPRRFMYATPSAKYLPVHEPVPEDPKAGSWSIVYRIICEKENRRPITQAEFISPQPKRTGSRRRVRGSGRIHSARALITRSTLAPATLTAQ